MKSLAAAAFLVLLSIILMGAPAVSDGAGMPVQAVETQGSSIVADGDRARARSEAVRDALQRAVAEVASLWLGPQEDERKKDLLKAQIYGKAEGFIQDFRIISETVTEDVYTVSIVASVLADSVRGDLRAFGLVGPGDVERPASRISLVIRGIRDYRSYSRCRGILREGKTGIRKVALREASWGTARFDVVSESAVPALAEWLQEDLAADIRHQDERAVEVDLR